MSTCCKASTSGFKADCKPAQCYIENMKNKNKPDGNKPDDNQPNVNIVLGPGTLSSLPELLAKHGSKVLLVHGHRPVEDGLLAKVRVLLNKANFEYANMGQILPNPKYSSVKRGIKVARKEKCDIILALGGGSTLQCAKGIALGMGYKGDVWDFWTGKKTPEKVYPVASILTNPASGDELSTGCTLVRKGKQETIHLEQLACTFAILDPNLSMYPLYPTMNQIFVVFCRLFFACLQKDHQRREKAASLAGQLLNTADALREDITNIKARTELYKIGLAAHQEVGKVNDPLSSLAGKLSFACSLPEGSALSALFNAWCNHLNLQQKEQLLEYGQAISQVPVSDWDSFMAILNKKIKIMELPLSLPQSGLMAANRELETLAAGKLEKEVLKEANQ